jgi:hypothetical protein
MLHHHAIQQLTSEHRLQREGEAEAHRLVLEARGSRRRRAWRRELAKDLVGLMGYVAVPSRRPGTSC